MRESGPIKFKALLLSKLAVPFCFEDDAVVEGENGHWRD